MAGIIPTSTPSQDIFIESDRSSHIDFQSVKTASDTMKVTVKTISFLFDSFINNLFPLFNRKTQN